MFYRYKIYNNLFLKKQIIFMLITKLFKLKTVFLQKHFLKG